MEAANAVEGLARDGALDLAGKILRAFGGGGGGRFCGRRGLFVHDWLLSGVKSDSSLLSRNTYRRRRCWWTATTPVYRPVLKDLDSPVLRPRRRLSMKERERIESAVRRTASTISTLYARGASDTSAAGI